VSTESRSLAYANNGRSRIWCFVRAWYAHAHERKKTAFKMHEINRMCGLRLVYVTQTNNHLMMVCESIYQDITTIVEWTNFATKWRWLAERRNERALFTILNKWERERVRANCSSCCVARRKEVFPNIIWHLYHKREYFMCGRANESTHCYKWQRWMRLWKNIRLYTLNRRDQPKGQQISEEGFNTKVNFSTTSGTSV
jgi:hypothetical protein